MPHLFIANPEQTGLIQALFMLLFVLAIKVITSGYKHDKKRTGYRHNISSTHREYQDINLN